MSPAPATAASALGDAKKETRDVAGGALLDVFITAADNTVSPPVAAGNVARRLTALVAARVTWEMPISTSPAAMSLTTPAVSSARRIRPLSISAICSRARICSTTPPETPLAGLGYEILFAVRRNFLVSSAV